ncbi:hypothetical protein GGG16DRAFT_112730 [Schizophyllum commune]
MGTNEMREVHVAGSKDYARSKDTQPLLPIAETKGQRGWSGKTCLRLLAFVLAAALLGRSALYSTQAERTLAIAASAKAYCAQPDALYPTKNAELYDELDGTFGTAKLKERAIDWLGGAIRVPTETYDDLDEVGQDPRWEKFGPFHDYLLKAFPLVHSSLKLTKINTYGLLYEWPGTDDSLKPFILLAHQDVVPVNPQSVDEWTHPPFSGHFDGERIWGRGASDDKSGLIGTLAAVELLIEQGFKPTRSIFLAFGFDEECGGRRGAKQIGKYLLDKYGEDYFALLIDEGGGYVEQFGTVFATPGIAEKGSITIRFEVDSPGGHSSVPPPHTSIGILAQLIVAFEDQPYGSSLVRDHPIYADYQCYAEHGKELDSSLKDLIKKSATDEEALKELEQYVFETNNFHKASLGTTTAVDIVGGGVKSNALPEQAFVVINHRISTSSNSSTIQAGDIARARPIAEKFNLTLEAFGETLSNPAYPSFGRLAIGSKDQFFLDPAPVTPFSADSKPWNLLGGTIKAVHAAQVGEDIVVAPGVPSGNTDTRFYWDLTPHIFRYNHRNSGTGGGLASGVHTVNENIEADDFLEIIRFFTTLILNVDEATDI